MCKYITLPVVSLLALTLAACSMPSNANLEQARSNFPALQSQPDAIKAAALGTKDAGDRLTEVNKAYQDGEDQCDVDQLAYPTDQRIKLARQTIVLRNTETQLQNASAQYAQVRPDARITQLDKLRSQPNAKQILCGIMVTSGDVPFDPDKSDLKPGAMCNIQQLTELLQQNLERQVIVEGYTGSIDSANYNQCLSECRTDSMRIVLFSRGVSPERVATRGYGREYPMTSNDTSPGHTMNRRVGVTTSNDAKPVASRFSVSG